MHWQPITDEHPKPLDDVLVSVFDPNVFDEPLVYQAYRRDTNPSQFVITGTVNGVLGHVYAWAPVPPAAPLPEADRL